MVTTAVESNLGPDGTDASSNVGSTDRESDDPNIPVRNWWHMLLYAWDLVDLSGLFDAKWERAPDLRALLTQILAELTNRQIRRGLRGDYVDRSETLKTVRGGIDFNRTLSDLLLYKGQLHCEYQEYSLNVPRNQIIATTLHRLMRRGLEKINDDRRREVMDDVERLVRIMSDIDDVGLSRSLIATEMRKLGANEREYKLMLRICEMLYEPRMPLDVDDDSGESFSDWIRQREHRIYERFVANFYRMELRRRGWDVSAPKRIRWRVTGGNAENEVRLPSMEPDIVLTHKDSGKIVVVDTKWYSSVVTDRFDKLTVHSNNLYQMYAYMASQDYVDDAHRTASGILLYAQTKISDVDFRTEIDHHPFWVYTLDLSRNWSKIEDDLVELIEGAVCDE